jgi:hypothetical protein
MSLWLSRVEGLREIALKHPHQPKSSLTLDSLIVVDDLNSEIAKFWWDILGINTFDSQIAFMQLELRKGEFYFLSQCEEVVWGKVYGNWDQVASTNNEMFFEEEEEKGTLPPNNYQFNFFLDFPNNDNEFNDNEFNDNEFNDNEFNDNEFNYGQRNDIQLNDIQLNDIQLNDIQLNDIQLNDNPLDQFNFNQLNGSPPDFIQPNDIHNNLQSPHISSPSHQSPPTSPKSPSPSSHKSPPTSPKSPPPSSQIPINFLLRTDFALKLLHGLIESPSPYSHSIFNGVLNRISLSIASLPPLHTPYTLITTIIDLLESLLQLQCSDTRVITLCDEVVSLSANHDQYSFLFTTSPSTRIEQLLIHFLQLHNEVWPHFAELAFVAFEAKHTLKCKIYIGVASAFVSSSLRHTCKLDDIFFTPMNSRLLLSHSTDTRYCDVLMATTTDEVLLQLLQEEDEEIPMKVIDRLLQIITTSNHNLTNPKPILSQLYLLTSKQIESQKIFESSSFCFDSFTVNSLAAPLYINPIILQSLLTCMSSPHLHHFLTDIMKVVVFFSQSDSLSTNPTCREYFRSFVLATSPLSPSSVIESTFEIVMNCNLFEDEIIQNFLISILPNLTYYFYSSIFPTLTTHTSLHGTEFLFHFLTEMTNQGYYNKNSLQLLDQYDTLRVLSHLFEIFQNSKWIWSPEIAEWIWKKFQCIPQNLIPSKWIVLILECCVGNESDDLVWLAIQWLLQHVERNELKDIFILILKNNLTTNLHTISIARHLIEILTPSEIVEFIPPILSKPFLLDDAFEVLCSGLIQVGCDVKDLLSCFKKNVLGQISPVIFQQLLSHSTPNDLPDIKEFIGCSLQWEQIRTLLSFFAFEDQIDLIWMTYPNTFINQKEVLETARALGMTENKTKEKIENLFCKMSRWSFFGRLELAYYYLEILTPDEIPLKITYLLCHSNLGFDTAKFFFDRLVLMKCDDLVLEEILAHWWEVKEFTKIEMNEMIKNCTKNVKEKWLTITT